MSEEKKTPEDQPQPEIEEVVTDFGDVRVRSGFEIEEVEHGVLEVNLFGPFFEFLDDDPNLEDEEDNEP